MPTDTPSRLITLSSMELSLVIRAIETLLTGLRLNPDGTLMSPEEFFATSVCAEDKETYLRSGCLLSDLKEEAKRRTPRRTKSTPVNLPG